MQSLLVAVTLLTILPLRSRVLPSTEVVARARYWFPVVGALLGGLLGGVLTLIGQLQTPAVGVFFVLAAWIGLTGALHLDGWLDLCDGLLAHGSSEDRLRILKDPHMGSFAFAGGALLLLGKLSALHALLGRAEGPALLGAAIAEARCWALVMAACGNYPRPEGTGKVIIEATRGWEAAPFAGLAVGMALAVAPWTGLAAALASCGAALLVVLFLTLLSRRRLGGITGDCLGAAIEAAEAVNLLAAAVVVGISQG